MSDIEQFTSEELSGIGIGPSHGVAMERINALIAKVNGMDTPSEIPYTPTTGDDWPGVDPTNIQEAFDGLAGRDARDIEAVVAGITVQTDESEQSADLSGVAAKAFLPTHLLLVVTEATGAVAKDGTINVGTSTGGNDLASAQALTNLDDAGDALMLPLAELDAVIAGNATIYVNVEAADTTATTLVLTAILVGKQVAYA